MILKNLTRAWPVDRQNIWLETLKPLWQELGEKNQFPLRFAIVAVGDRECTLELTVAEVVQGEEWTAHFDPKPLIDLSPRKFCPVDAFAVVQIIPTGINCSFGGYAGDATPVTNLLSKCCDVVVTHPNAVNASDINELSGNTLYVEGRSLDDFMLGEVGLERALGPKRIGTIVDPTGRGYFDEVIHALNAGMAVGGFSCDTYTVCDADFGVEIGWTPTGCATGTIKNAEVLLKGAHAMLDLGMEALGVVSVIHGVTREMCERHIAGHMPNPSGAVEAIITHLLSKVFRVPVAHAPLPYYQSIKHQSVDNPRASAEFISTPHYFSVLKGLNSAPLIIDGVDARAETITVADVGAVVVPATSLGGIPVLAAELHNIPIIAVKENSTILSVDQRAMRLSQVIEVESYLEAAGVVTALRNGISVSSLRRPLPPARAVKSPLV